MPGPGMEIVDDREVKEVLDVLEGRWLNRYGDPRNKRFKAKVFTFEGKFARYSKVRYCVATSSGTSALLCALAALGVGPGDEVIVPGYTYIASVSSIISFGALPVLAEIDETLNLDPRDVEAKITARTKAVMIVHMLGNPARLDELLAVARKHKLPVIEDACQACGAKYRGRPVGSLGDLGAFSFNMFKTITAGDGGVVITNSRKLYAKAFAYHDQGHKPLRTGVEVGARSMIGLDFRMNEVTGAILIAQLAKLDRICRTLRRNKSRLKKAIEPALRSKGFGFRARVALQGFWFPPRHRPEGRVRDAVDDYRPHDRGRAETGQSARSRHRGQVRLARLQQLGTRDERTARESVQPVPVQEQGARRAP